jgi:hypothetical protein
MLYDANQVFRQEPDAFHYFKYASLIFSSSSIIHVRQRV